MRSAARRPMLVGVGLVLAASGAAGGVLPLVDAHLHYSADAWAELSPAQVLALLDRAGIRRAFVSSTPDEGTVRRELFLRHPDRFLVGTDTWVPSRWGELEAVQAWTRGWLAELPPDVARRLAWENAERLAGGAR